MIKALIYIVELLILAAAVWLGSRWWRHTDSGIKKTVGLVFFCCAVLMAFSASNAVQPKRAVTVSALGEANPAAELTELTISHFKVNGVTVKIFSPQSGKWTLYEEQYRWFEPGDTRAIEKTTDSVTFGFNMADQVEIVFWGNQWKGIAQVEVDGVSYRVDTYRAESGEVSFALPKLSALDVVRSILLPTMAFTAILILICGLGFIASLLGKKVWGKLSKYSHVQKLQKYQFLFEELVKRDFKKKYKRTVLGVAWSVLSPLLTLFVMRLVFTQFFGNHVAHYTIYLFCGNLVFSYFNESTSQGMTCSICFVPGLSWARYNGALLYFPVGALLYLFGFMNKNRQTAVRSSFVAGVLSITLLLNIAPNIERIWLDFKNYDTIHNQLVDFKALSDSSKDRIIVGYKSYRFEGQFFTLYDMGITNFEYGTVDPQNCSGTLFNPNRALCYIIQEET